MENKEGRYQTKRSFNAVVQKNNTKSESYQKAIQQISQNLYYDLEYGWFGDDDIPTRKTTPQKSEKTITTKKPVLDIFDRIKDQEEKNGKKVEFEKLGVVQKGGVFVVQNPVFDETKIDEQNFAFQPAKYQKCEVFGRDAEQTVNDFYDYILKRKNANKNLLEDKKFMAYLQDGINFVYFDDQMIGELYKQMTEQELRLLFDYGMNMEVVLHEVSFRKDIYHEQMIYNAVEHIQSPLMYTITARNLEKLINTRKQISFYESFCSDYIDSAASRHDFEYIKNIEMMFRYGQCSLTAEQVKKIGERFSSKLDLVPLIKSVYEYCKDTTKTTTDTQTSDSQYGKTDSQKSQDAKNQIEKLFEEAQRNI